MAAPTYIQANTGATDATGAFTFTGAVGTAGDLTIIDIFVDGTGAISWGTLSATNISALDGTANTWTLVGTFNAGDPTAAQRRIYMGRRTSASAPTFTGSANTSGDDLYARMYDFRNVSAGTTLATVIENVTAGSTVTEVGTSATASDASVTVLGVDRLALNFVGVNDDNAISVFSGETGGDWVQQTTYAESGGTDAAISIQTSYVGPLSITYDTSTTAGALPIQGETGFDEMQAQSFSVASDVTISTVTVTLGKQGTPADDVICEIQADSAGAPSGVALGSASVSASTLTAFSVSTSFSMSLALTASTTYWMVLSRSGARDESNYARVDRSGASVYSGGVRSTSNSGVWTNDTQDLYMALQAASSTVINGGTGSIVASDAWGVTGFALIGTTPASTDTYENRYYLQSVNRASVY